MDWFSSLNDILTPFLTDLLVATGVGLIIGLEREFNTHADMSHLGGIRTFTLVSIFGYGAGHLAGNIGLPILLAAFAGFFTLVAVAYYVQARQGNSGLTTELALLLTFILGALIAEGYIRESLSIVVIVTVVLSLKAQLHRFAEQITVAELFAFIKFIVLALLVMPLLPDKPFGPEGILNARDIGWIVMLVLTINFIGYILLKISSKQKGILLTAFVGGLFSSTMIAWVFSVRSREKPELSGAYGAGIVLASSVMFVRVFMVTSLFAFPVAKSLLLPLLFMLLGSLVPSYQVMREPTRESDAPDLAANNPLDIKNALFFAVLYIAVALLMYGSRQWLGETFAYLSGAMAGIADIDAITINTAKWASGRPDNVAVAGNIILLAVLSNSLFKLAVSLVRGMPGVRKPVLVGFGLVLLAGVVFLLFRIPPTL
ncbi:MAG: MgtC/SapB family protein [Lewinellaceae bacterium]|nr:MgtC/SapB family protein [Saprospiraceae bacterium]MCB9355979.1 MgtC/SapB family protein [Lewinellaceae bacterium]